MTIQMEDPEEMNLEQMKALVESFMSRQPIAYLLFGVGAMSGLRGASARGVATWVSTSTVSFSLTCTKLGDWRAGWVCTLSSL